VTGSLAEISAPLSRTPRLLHDLLDGLPETWTETPDIDGGWQPREVVGHLITGELTDWMVRARLILEHGTAVPFEPFERFAMLERDAGVPLTELVQRFDTLRAANLAALGEIVSDADLERRGRHPRLGDVALRELLAAWAVHDLDHVSQICVALAGSHDGPVGPWKAYLGILLRRDDPAAVAG
jgi:hypothetical protein